MEEKKRLHFGVLFSAIDNTCQCKIWDGIVRYAKEKDIHLTAYLGTYQTREDAYESHYETCFETIKANSSLDGIILFAGFIAEDIGLEKFREYIERIPKEIPLISVSFTMPGIPSVMVNNEAGIYDAAIHLIERHNKKNIAFVKGPNGHTEAEERLAGFKKALKAKGIEFDERYVLPGHFSQETGRKAVATLIDERKIPYDAIMASDDETAMGVLDELKSRNILVPADVAVTGFDDDWAAATFIPSIGTVRQAFFEIGMKSAEILHMQINKMPVDDVTYVSPIFIPRQSCGCLEKSFTSTMRTRLIPAISSNSIESYVFSKFTNLFEQYDVPAELFESWADAFVKNIVSPDFDEQNFLHLFNNTLIHYGYNSHDFSPWQKALNILSNAVEFYKKELEYTHHSIVLAINSAATLVFDMNMKGEETKENALVDTQQLLRRVSSTLALTFDIDSLAEKMFDSLPEISINSAFVGLYRNSINSDELDADRTIDTLIGFDEGRKFDIKHNIWNPILFSDYSTIDNFNFERERRTLFFIPLFFKNEEIGVMLLPYEKEIPIDAYETLRVSVSTAAKGAKLLSTVQTLSITDELTGLMNRRGFFQFVYSRIQHLARRTEIIPLVFFLDMDGLKHINDTFGHKEGDIAISAFAQMLKETFREEDIIGRLGGDEFVVFVSVKTKENGKKLVKRLRNKFEEYNAQKNHSYIVTASVGCVDLEITTKECFEAAMLKADEVLYEEKMEKKKLGLSRQ